MIANGSVQDEVRPAQPSGDAQEHTPSDHDLAKAVRLTLRHEQAAALDTVRVRVSNGWVTLSGEVEDKRSRERALRVIGKVPRIRGISNLILIRPHIQVIEPETIHQAIEGALAAQANREARRITVTIDRDTVVLTGDVRSWAERCAAVGAAHGTPGVQTVTDRLHLTSSA